MRERHRAFAPTIEDIVTNPNTIDVSEAVLKDFVRANREELTERFKRASSRYSPAERVRIGYILLRAGEPSGAQYFIEALEEGDEAAKSHAVQALRFMPPRTLSRPDSIRALALLRQRLEDASQNIGERKLALYAILSLDLDEEREILLGLLTNPEPTLRSEAATTLARVKDPACLPVIREILAPAPADEDDRYFAVNALLDLADSAEPEVAAEARSLALREIDARLGCAGYRAANDVWRLFDVLERLPPAEQKLVLERVMGSRLEEWVRGFALERLAKLEEYAALPRLLSALDDAALRRSAVKTIGSLGARAASPAVMERLERLFATAEHPEETAVLFDAFVALGMVDDPAVTAQMAKLDPWRRFTLRSRAAGMTLDQLIARLVDAAILDSALVEGLSAEDHEEIAECWRSGDAEAALCELLLRCKGLHWFDAEDADVPPDYAALLAVLAEIGGQRVGFECAHLEPSEDKARDHRLTLLINGLPARLPLRNAGDWIDVAGLLDGLNAELARQGETCRFVTLHETGQTAQIILGDGAKLLALQQTLDFPLDADEVKRLSQEYGRHAPQS
ncbi:HEAT repeat domain-containing protein [Methylocystis bryophila]|uniref:HEAT repeat domain-containing protein n=2 Tax=Methylocystis bryophila TaxID=655015 RepID=A0A1W6MX34_9HYPH|nr:hypothetical protein [Methylocystis bryophila]ARN82143.1 hypothetical protein B1812_14830 [Methylocystis bryophila]